MQGDPGCDGDIILSAKKTDICVPGVHRLQVDDYVVMARDLSIVYK